MTRSKKSPRHLSREDQEIWSRITATARPLSGEDKNFANMLMANDIPDRLQNTYSDATTVSALRISTASIYQPVLKPPKLTAPGDIDSKTNRKISKGKIAIDGRVDLHGYNQQRARQFLFETIENAFYTGKRTILVITGKGNLGQGVLKTNVPNWLAAPDFRALITSFSQSSPAHGGEGALYVRIRRKR